MKVLQMHDASGEKKTRSQAVIFDLDGTLVDTAPDLAAALNDCLARDGHAPFKVSEMRGLVGRGAAALLNRGYTLREGAAPSPEKLATLRRSFLEYYGAHIADNSAPFDGVEEVLQALRREGVALGICTNKPHEMALALVDHLGWTDLFGHVVGGDVLGLKKPDPMHIFAVCEALDVPAKHCAFIGDSEVDYDAARAAQMPMILVRFGYSNRSFDEMPEAVQIDHYCEFMDALDRL